MGDLNVKLEEDVYEEDAIKQDSFHWQANRCNLYCWWPHIFWDTLVSFHDDKTKIHTTAAHKHIAEVEHIIRTLKEHGRCVISNLHIAGVLMPSQRACVSLKYCPPRRL